MSIIQFPSSPTLYQTYTVGSKTWIWNGYAWDLQLANSAIITSLAQGAYNQANTALPNTGNIITVNSSSIFVISNTSPSTSNTTGALIVSGGVGITGNVYASNTVFANNLNTSWISTSDSYIKFNNDLFVSGNLVFDSSKTYSIVAGGGLNITDSTLFFKNASGFSAYFNAGNLTATTQFNFPLGSAGISTLVDLQSAQTITGAKTFSGTPFVVSSATTTLGSSAGATTIGLGTGATTTGIIKNINIGTAGVANSTTTIAIGSSVSGSKGSTTIQTPNVIITAANTAQSSVQLLGTIPSTSITTGTLVISGGMGVAGNIYASNVVTGGYDVLNYINTANTFLQANDAITLSSAKSYTDTANTFLQANDAITLSSAKSYVDGQISYISGVDNQQNTRLSTVEANTIYISGVDNQQNTWISSNNSYFQGALNAVNTNIVTANTNLKSYVDNTFLPKSGGTVTGTLYISNTTQAISATGPVGITGDLTVSGNIFLSGSSTTYNSNVAVIQDPMIYLSKDNSADAVDIGFYGSFTGPGTSGFSHYQHTGLVRDINDKKWKLFSNVPEPQVSNSYINFANALYDTLKVGGLDLSYGNIVSANAITSNTFSGNGASLTSLTAGNLSGTIPSAVLGNSTQYVGTTAIALNRASASQALTGITSIDGSAPAGFLSGTTLSSNVTSSSLTSVGTLTGLTVSGSTTLSGGTANGVLYLNSSKAVTSGTGLVFDGTNVGIGTNSPSGKIDVTGSLGKVTVDSSGTLLSMTYGANNYIRATSASGVLNIGAYDYLTFQTGSGFSEQMRLNSTGLGIGTSSAVSKLDVLGNVNNSATGLNSNDSATIAVRNLNPAALQVKSKVNFGLTDGSGTYGYASIAGIYSNYNGTADIGTSLAFGTQFNAAGGTVERMRIDSSGAVGIGTSSLSNGVRTVIQGSQTGGAPQTSGTTQTYGLLRLQGTSFTSVLDFGTNGGNYNWIQATDSGNLATNYSLVLNPNGGNVGIGTSSPGQKLHVAGAIAATGQAPSLMSSSTFFDYISSLNTARFAAVGNTTGAAAPIIFSQYSSNGSVGRDAVTIDSSGNVGIGTSSPGTKLDILCSTNAGLRVSDGTYTGIMFPSGLGGIATGTTSNSPYIVLTNNAERMRIDSSGNVGIGTSLPGYKLDVAGTANTGPLTVNGISSHTSSSAIPQSWTTTSSIITKGPYGGMISLQNTGGTSDGYVMYLTGTTSQLNFGYANSTTLVSTPATLSSAGVFTATSFSGAGTGLSGTATSLSIGGSAPAGSLTGTVPTSVLGSGTANANTYLAGDNTWKSIGTFAYIRQSFTATSGQTTFSITGGYTPGNVDVYRNGVKLLNGTDVTVTSGTNVVLTVGAILNDTIEVVGISNGGISSNTTGVIINTGLLVSSKEKITVSATAATGNINYDVTSQSLLYYTASATTNFALNVRGSSTTSLNNTINTGESITVVFLNTNGASAYYANNFYIDGTSISPKWQNGTSPSSGNASSIDSYTYTIIKTGNATFTVLASQTKFA